MKIDLAGADGNDVIAEPALLAADEVADLMLSVMSDTLDHPELWDILPNLLANAPDLPNVLRRRAHMASNIDTCISAQLLMGLCAATVGDPASIIEVMTPIVADYSLSPLVQGVMFHLHALADPSNPKYTLAGTFCDAPFRQMDVLETSSHLCCASWMQESVGNLAKTPWPLVWDSATAQAIRGSIHDGSYRYCNKMACPRIQGATLPPAGDVARRSEYWQRIVEDLKTEITAGPEAVNLAYDRTCNLSCPSCRIERYAADEATRVRYDDMQENAILPLLKNAKTVFITGSGDPFASKNFRSMMKRLTPEEYPDLRFLIMTNGMLFTPGQWEQFPTLHRRVRALKISIDAATGPTHELLRRGARWPVMMQNMMFAGSLRNEGLIEDFELLHRPDRQLPRDGRCGRSGQAGRRYPHPFHAHDQLGHIPARGVSGEGRNSVDPSRPRRLSRMHDGCAPTRSDRVTERSEGLHPRRPNRSAARTRALSRRDNYPVGDESLDAP